MIIEYGFLLLHIVNNYTHVPTIEELEYSLKKGY